MVFYNMHDGRAFTFYGPNCELNNHLMKDKSKTANTHSYRKYLQKNAEKLMKELADCAPINEKCEICPVCNKAVEYKPTGNEPTGLKIDKITTHANPYNLNPNI